MTNTIAFIGARGGSKGLPRKNLRLLKGKPLISYAINDAKQAKLVNRVIVATDDKEIAEVAKQYGAVVPFLLPEELCANNAKMEPSIKYVIEQLEERENYKTDILVYLQSTDFFRKPEWIDWCIQQLLDDLKLDSAFAAQKSHKNYWHKVGEKYQRLREGDKFYGIRQGKTPVYREDTGIACATRASLIKQGFRTGDKIKILEYDSFWHDIHDEFDLWLVEKVMTEWNKKKAQSS